jgi:hypothetical protein
MTYNVLVSPLTNTDTCTEANPVEVINITNGGF